MKKLAWLFFGVFCLAVIGAVTYQGGFTTLGVVDFSGSSETKSVKTGTGAAPGTCNSGDLYLRTGQGSPSSQLFFCDPANTQTAIGATPGMVLIEEHTASASGELDFTTCIQSSYDNYEIKLENLVPTTSGTKFQMQFGTGGGPTYDTGNNYEYAQYRAITSPSNGVLGASGIGSIIFDNGVGTTANWFGMNGSVDIFSPAGALFKALSGTLTYFGSDNAVLTTGFHGGGWNSTSPATAFRFFYGTIGTNTIASGTARCYGFAK